MATTTTNYGFDVPTSSDLVKNGATQIALLGQDIDTFLFRPFSKNGIINSAMDIWQRGTSIAVTSTSTSFYGADRWQVFSASTGRTVSRQVTGDTTNLPNIQYCQRVSRDSGNTNTAAILPAYSMETADSVRFAGQQVTLSFYARKGANYSATSSALTYVLRQGTGTDQNLNAGYTGSSDVFSTTATLTTTWQRFQTTGTLTATTSEIGVQFNFTPTGTAGAADYFEVTGVMLEAGNQASPYTPATATYATELAACQRYYFRAQSTGGYKILGSGYAGATGSLNIAVPLPSQMRVIPTSLETSAMASYYYESGAGGTTPTTVTLSTSATENIGSVVVAKAASFVAGGAYWLFSNNTAAYLGFSAEL